MAKDVLEHVHPKELKETIKFLSRIGKMILVVVPVSEKNGEKQSIVYDDKTHLSALADHEWHELLSEVGTCRQDEALNIVLKKSKNNGNCSFIVSVKN